ncbi:MAG TPA: exodeoxyribonuclease V subunit gamma [Chthoniobacterales bacterium]
MLRAFTSNLQERLSARLAATLRAEPLSDPFATELIVVQSLGMRRWLQMEIARHNGICACIDFPFPQKFIHDLLEKIYPDESKHLKDFSREIFEWRVYAWLNEHSSEFPDLHRYLSNANPQSESRDAQSETSSKTWQLAARIAYFFDQYSAYRPDWLLRLRNAEFGLRNDARERAVAFDGWQSDLWQALGTTTHPAALRHRFLTEVTQIPTRKLPERLSVFGLATLPPWYLKFLEGLALRIPVDLYILQPTPEFWGDLETRREIDRRRQRGVSHRSETIQWNPLLASWGKTGRDFFRLTMDCEGLDENSDFAESPGSGLLGELQRDLLHPERANRRDIASDDMSSLQIHSCPGPMREVEIFRDQLLALFEQIPDLEPHDVLVMTPELDKYAPLIDAVFGSPENESIPYSLADRTRGGPEDPGVILLRLFEVALGRFGATEVVDLLELPAIRSRFEIVETDLELIRFWISETGIRWGLSASHRRDFHVPEFHQNTWRAGLDRLLLGFAMASVDHQLYAGVSPFELTENSEAALLGRLIEFIDRMSELRETISRPAALDEWAAHLHNVLRTFFTSESLDTRDAWAMKSAVENLEKASFFVTGKVPFEAVRLHLEAALSPDESQLGYLNGGVTFCACRPMRSVPFRVIAMLGMNDGVFPRASPISSLDLMAVEPRLGDRSQREDDRYLFLEAILSARDVLYLSYHGRSVRDGTTLLPSVLIAELLDYVDDQFNQKWSEKIVTRHPMQAFAPAYFSDRKLFSFSESNLNAAEALVGPRTEKVPFVEKPMECGINASKAIQIQEFITFFAHPTKYFVSRQLGIKLRKTDEIEADTEPFSVGSLTKYNLKEDVMSSLLSTGGIGEPELRWKAEGILPPGVRGSIESQELCETSNEFFAKISSWLEPDSEPVEIDLEVAGTRLAGRLSLQTRYRPAQMKTRDQIEAFVSHIIVNAAGFDVHTRLIMENESYVWEPMAAAEAGKILETFIILYRQGLTEPLPFFPKSSLEWMLAKKNPFLEALKKWRGDNRSPGESADPYFKLCFGHLDDPFNDRFAKIAETILRPLLDRRRELHGISAKRGEPDLQ